MQTYYKKVLQEVEQNHKHKNNIRNQSKNQDNTDHKRTASRIASTRK